jgi:hypothetical protein
MSVSAVPSGVDGSCDEELDRTMRLLAAALEETELRLPRATVLESYHQRCNEVARKSHARTWRSEHGSVKFLRMSFPS